jgi:hypothetical protein
MGLMKPDLYTKAVLTAIAIMLTVIACNQYVTPRTTVEAQSSPFAGVQFAQGNDLGGFDFFDPKTEEVWEYAGSPDDNAAYPRRHWKIPALGKSGTVTFVPALKK